MPPLIARMSPLSFLRSKPNKSIWPEAQDKFPRRRGKPGRLSRPGTMPANTWFHLPRRNPSKSFPSWPPAPAR